MEERRSGRVHDQARLPALDVRGQDRRKIFRDSGGLAAGQHDERVLPRRLVDRRQRARHVVFAPDGSRHDEAVLVAIVLVYHAHRLARFAGALEGHRWHALERQKLQ